ncbi:ATP-binding protein [Phytohabitans houttuyneae]|uniref:LuxR family transcriptional regulator n=1 Tax=Phytohabitans houttuyneae TaxID=1076126 RepID=A0A6V8K9Y3_9ACTN|nr:AAA family ATPase [Phytohabitans houttuyneae]GFJ77545.1 LuxR family transcriptional regulator [Phytohabitans houttuyneae]
MTKVVAWLPVDGVVHLDDLVCLVSQSLRPDSGDSVGSLLDEIRLLHRQAGEPSSREVMRRIGRGILSHTTVNAVLRGQRVPRWDPLQQVVAALSGDVEHFRTLWMKARDAEDQALAAAEPSPVLTAKLVGRARELHLLRARVVEVFEGRGGAVLIDGDPGIGKSYLMRAVSAYAAAQGCRTLWASCDELSQAFPLLPLVDTVDAAIPAAERVTPAVATVFEASASSGDRIDLVAAATERLLALVDELCASTPVALMVDDIQWADTTTMVALRRLLRMTQRLPLLVVAAARRIPHRRDLSVLRRALPPSNRIHLSGLSGAEVAEFLAAAAGGPPGPHLTELAAGAGGNPLYLTELMAALARAAALVPVAGRVEIDGGSAPGSLAAAIADRLEFLSEQARVVLRTAALLGTEFSVTELIAVLGRGINELLPMLDEAIEAGVLREDGRQMAFRHPLLRTALYEETPHSVRAAWHRDAAKALAAVGAPPERVARQLLPAIDSEVADHWTASWLAGVADELIGRAPAAAIPLLRWVVARGPSGTPHYDLLVCRLADALRRTGETADAARLAGESVARTGDPDLLVDLMWTFAEATVSEGHPEDAFAMLGPTLARPALEPRHRARLMVIAARTRCMIGEVEAGGKLARTALEAATRAEDPPTTARALSVLSAACGMRGEAAESLRLCERALAVAKDDPALADLWLTLQLNRGAVLCHLDRRSEAIDAAERVRASADRAGNVLRLGQARTLLIELLFDVGRWDDALMEAHLVLDGQAHPDDEATVWGVANVIRAHRDPSFPDKELCKQDWRATKPGGRVVAPWHLAMCLAHERTGRGAEALTLLTGALDESEEVNVAVDLLADAARLAMSLGNSAGIQVVLDQVEIFARRNTGSSFEAVALHAAGLVGGDPVRLGEAARRYAAAGRPLPQAQALEAAAVALAEAGDAGGARANLDAARSLYAGLGAEWDLIRTASLLPQ